MRAALACVCACALVLCAHAQPPRNGAGPPAEPSPPAYVDRVIEGLGAAEEEAAASPYDAEGYPRFLRLETRLGREPFGDTKVQGGVAVSAGTETANYGAMSIDATASNRKGGSLATVRQRAMPLADGRFLNNEAGVITPLPVDTMRIPTRVVVPNAVVLGAGTEWRAPGPSGVPFLGDATVLHASSGRFGRIQGYPTAGFKALPGTITTAGFQTTVEDWIVGGRAAHAEGVSEYDDPPAGTRPITGNSAQLSARLPGERSWVQANVIATRSNEPGNTKYGAWIDGEWRTGPTTQGWGVFHLDRDLKWAGQSMVNDLEGAYVRSAWHTRRWSAQGNVDVYRPATGADDVGIYATASGQWRYSRTLTFGLGGNFRHQNGDSGTGYGEVRWEHAAGRSGLRAETTRTGDDRSLRLVYDHDWVSPLGWTVTASLIGGRERLDGVTGDIRGVALSLSAPLGNTLTLLGNVSAERRSRGDRYENANLSLSWRLASRWYLDANAYYNHGRIPLAAPLDPFARPDQTVSTTDAYSYFLVLRFEDFAGLRRAPLGGRPEGGAGRIAGIVYLDANRSGRREAGESGAAGVTVYLDGRFATRTDARGRFEFPLVAPGRRVLSVLNETLPLPWQVVDRGEIEVEAVLRDTVEVAIPVVRPE